MEYTTFTTLGQQSRNGSIPWQHLFEQWRTLSGMPYTLNPYLPRVRAVAVRYVRERGWTMRKTARYLGVQPSSVSRWLARAPDGPVHAIPTASSRPYASPRAIDPSIVERIRAVRMQRGRCAEVVHAQLAREGTIVSLSTVKRTLVREGLLRTRSPWKHLHQSGERPTINNAGDLVEVDSIHLMTSHTTRTYIITLIDCCSRWAFARAVPRITAPAAVRVVGQARSAASFPFACIQSDHGSEFSTHFTRKLLVWKIRHRHSRVRQPNDNAHIERFNRTIQDELHTDILRYRDNLRKLNASLADYLAYYNTQRLHLGLGCQTPEEVLQRS